MNRLAGRGKVGALGVLGWLRLNPVCGQPGGMAVEVGILLGCRGCGGKGELVAFREDGKVGFNGGGDGE